MGPIATAARLARRILDLLLLILILVCLGGMALGKLVPLMGGQTLAIGGASMAPVIPVGSAVIVTPVAPDDLAVGDVVSLVAGDARSVFTHRIVRIVGEGAGREIQTQGDANPVPDPSLVPIRDVLGRVTWTIPYAGFLITLLSLPVGIAFVLGVALALLACAWLLETLELRGAARRSRVLRKVRVPRPRDAEGWLAAGPSIAASAVAGVTAHIAASRNPLAAAARPNGAAWILPGRVVPAPDGEVSTLGRATPARSSGRRR